MIKKCKITNKRFNNAYAISHSHVRIKKKQQANLQLKRIWLEKEKKYVKLRISTKAIKSIYKP